MYSYDEIIKYFNRKKKDYFDKRKADYEFLVTLATACMGGGKKEGEFGKADETGYDEMSDDDFDNWRGILGEKEFYETYGNYLELDKPED